MYKFEQRRSGEREKKTNLIRNMHINQTNNTRCLCCREFQILHIVH